MAVDVRRFPWIRRLAADYAFNFHVRRTVFRGRSDPAVGVGRRHRGGPRRTNRHRADIAAVLNAQQTRRGAPAAAVEAASKLADSSTVAVVTGQQAGLFGGPLFTLLKALTALQAGRPGDTQTTASRPSPIFWIDAEDHDWNEVRSCTVFDGSLEARSIALPAQRASEPAPVATVQLDPSITAALDELEQILPPTEFRPALMADLRDAYAEGAAWRTRSDAGWSACSATAGSSSTTASDPASKPIASRVFVSELSEPGETAKLAAAAGAQPRLARLPLAGPRAGRRHGAVSSRWRPPRDTSAGGPVRRRAIRRFATATLVKEASERPTALQSERAAPSHRAGHAVPDRLLRGGPERARVSRAAARCVRPVRHSRCR